MSLTLSPQVPNSVHSISTKYNIPTRLWGNAFHRVLEYLRRQSLTSPIALEHLTDMIYWAYSFYTALVEDPLVEVFKGAWHEALGELARYRMAVAAMTPMSFPVAHSHPLPPLSTGDESDSPSPSVGAQAAIALEVEPEREQWRRTARYWYALGLMDTPGNGRLHHHLGLLSRDAECEDLRAVYHFLKRCASCCSFTF
jgi:protein SMG6